MRTVTFDLSTDQLDKLLKAAAIYQLADLSVVGGEGVVKVLVRDKKNETSNDFSIIVGETDGTFSFNFKVENIKILLVIMMLLFHKNYYQGLLVKIKI